MSPNKCWGICQADLTQGELEGKGSASGDPRVSLSGVLGCRTQTWKTPSQGTLEGLCLCLSGVSGNLMPTGKPSTESELEKDSPLPHPAPKEQPVLLLGDSGLKGFGECESSS